MEAFFKKWLSLFQTAFTVTFGVILTLFFTFFCWDDLKIQSLCTKVCVLAIALVACLILSFVIALFLRKEGMWTRGSGSVTVSYGDLLEDAFRKNSLFHRAKEGLYVIPVNTNFDTIVEDETVCKPLVASETIQGKWLRAYSKQYGLNHQEIQNIIYRDLDDRGYQYTNVAREKGSQRRYKLGTCSIVKGLDGRNFILFALSEFNEINNALATRDSVIEATRELLAFINKSAQGKKSYIPLLGTGHSRTGMSHKESLHLLLSTMFLYDDIIVSPIEILIYSKDKRKVSIFDK